jgi:hypothetical protein
MDPEGAAAELGTRARQRSRIAPAGDGLDPAAPPARDFVPVELLGTIMLGTRVRPTGAPAEAPAEPVSLPVIAAEAEEGWADRTSLFGDAEA